MFYRFNSDVVVECLPVDAIFCKFHLVSLYPVVALVATLVQQPCDHSQFVKLRLQNIMVLKHEEEGIRKKHSLTYCSIEEKSNHKRNGYV